MEGLIVLGVFAGVWLLLVKLLKSQGWSAAKRHLAAVPCAFVAMLLVTGAIFGPVAPRSAALESEKGPQNTERVADVPVGANDAIDARIKKTSRDIVAIDRQDYAVPPRLVITLKTIGWDEAATFHEFATDATA